MGWKDIGIRKSEFVAKTQFLYSYFLFKLVKNNPNYLILNQAAWLEPFQTEQTYVNRWKSNLFNQIYVCTTLGKYKMATDHYVQEWVKSKKSKITFLTLSQLGYIFLNRGGGFHHLPPNDFIHKDEIGELIKGSDRQFMVVELRIQLCKEIS